MMHSFWNHVEAWKSSFSNSTVNVTLGHIHASFFNVQAIKMIKRVLINLKIGLQTRFDISVEDN